VLRGRLQVEQTNGLTLEIAPNMAYLVQPGCEVRLSTPAGPLVEMRLYGSHDLAPFDRIVAAGGPDLAPSPVRILQAPTPQECDRLSLLSYAPWQATAFWWHLASVQSLPQIDLPARRAVPQWLHEAITACTSGDGLRRGTQGLALAARRSPSQVRRVVQACYGCTATELIARLRLNRARTLLRSTDQPLGAIAETLGWRSEAWFSEVFAQHHDGTRPGTWRRDCRRGQVG
jgi:AraC-like DNA-binding protein